ncbi:Flavonoid 3'-monooxygenase [Bienertia sinuspersici]
MSLEATQLWSWWWRTCNKEDETSRNILTLLVPLLIIFWFIFSIKKQNKENPPLPPGPRGLPLVGYLLFLGSNLHHSFKELATFYGPIFRIKLGTKECIVITSPSLVKEVVRDKDVVFANRAQIIAAKSLLFGTMDIAFSDYAVEWRKMRKIFASEMLSNSSLDDTYFFRKQQVKKMINETYKKAGQLVDVGDLAFLTLIGSVMSMIWGETLKAEESFGINAEFRAVVNKQLELLGAPNISDLFPLLARFDLQGIERRMKFISRRNEEILDKVINHHTIAGNIKNKDFLGHLLHLTKCENPTRSLTLPQVKAMLMDAVTGGTDTTVAVVEWAMAEILKHPKVLKTIQEELTEVVGLSSIVEEAHLPKLKYLDAVVKETLRLHPPLLSSFLIVQASLLL